MSYIYGESTGCIGSWGWGGDRGLDEDAAAANCRWSCGGITGEQLTQEWGTVPSPQSILHSLSFLLLVPRILSMVNGPENFCCLVLLSSSLLAGSAGDLGCWCVKGLCDGEVGLRSSGTEEEEDEEPVFSLTSLFLRLLNMPLAKVYSLFGLMVQ